MKKKPGKRNNTKANKISRSFPLLGVFPQKEIHPKISKNTHGLQKDIKYEIWMFGNMRSSAEDLGTKFRLPIDVVELMIEVIKEELNPPPKPRKYPPQL